MLKPIFIGIAGGSGSGKTTLADKIKKFANQSLDSKIVDIIYTDYYYKRQDHLSPNERAKTNYDHPEALEFDLLAKHLDLLQSGKIADLPVYDFSKHTRTDRIVHFSPCPIIIVEGILALYPEILRKYYIYSVFVDTSDQLRLDRRIKRDIVERGRTKESVIEQWNDTVQPMFLKYSYESRKYANQIISSDEITDEIAQNLLTEIKAKLLSNSI
jgi:uridine kinase